MRISAFIVAALFVGGLYHIQNSPELSRTFSKENLLGAKFKAEPAKPVQDMASAKP